MPSPQTDAVSVPWVIVAAGLHFRGGMDKANAELASFLLQHGAVVHIVAHDVDRTLAAHPSARVHLVPRPMGSFALGEFGLDRCGRDVAAAVRASHPAARVVVNGGNCQWPDINWVHYVHHAWTDVESGAPLWFKAKHAAFSARWRRAEKAACHAARIVIANSELTRQHVIELLGVSPERVRTVYLGTDAQDAPPSPQARADARQWLGIEGDRLAAAFVGALGFDHRKGFDLLWAAWLRLHAAAAWEVDLVVAGGGAEVDRIRQDAEQAGLAPRVHVLGHTERVKDVLAAVDLLVSPVRYEPYGLNVQEAICCGVPALVSRSAGVAERYPRELDDMLLQNPEDVDELAARLQRWTAAAPEWKMRISALGSSLRSYGWPHMAEQFVDAARVEPAGQAEHPIAATRS